MGNKVNVVEFNARFGDPEAEVYMRLFDGDLYEVLTACSRGELDPSTVKWKKGFAVAVALASGGYPGNYDKGRIISGIDKAEAEKDIVVFHAGTKKDDDKLMTSGGRVLYVTALGETLEEAIEKAYKAASLINFEGVHYRKDIGKRARP
jgi:phosphoribosylamine--glycine ligase